MNLGTYRLLVNAMCHCTRRKLDPRGHASSCDYRVAIEGQAAALREVTEGLADELRQEGKGDLADVLVKANCDSSAKILRKLEEGDRAGH